VKGQKWMDLWWGDEICRWQLCVEPPRLRAGLCDLLVADEDTNEQTEMRELLTRQVMHRMIFALDLSRRMSAAWRGQFSLTGDFSEDARRVLIDGWRSNAVLVWSEQFGHEYVDQRQED